MNSCMCCIQFKFFNNMYTFIINFTLVEMYNLSKLDTVYQRSKLHSSNVHKMNEQTTVRCFSGVTHF